VVAEIVARGGPQAVTTAREQRLGGRVDRDPHRDPTGRDAQDLRLDVLSTETPSSAATSFADVPPAAEGASCGQRRATRPVGASTCTTVPSCSIAQSVPRASAMASTFAKPSLPVSTPLRGSIRSLPSGIVNLRAAQTASVPTASPSPPAERDAGHDSIRARIDLDQVASGRRRRSLRGWRSASGPTPLRGLRRSPAVAC